MTSKWTPKWAHKWHAGGARAGDGAGGVGAAGVGAAAGVAGDGGVAACGALKHSSTLLASAWRLHHITRFPFLCQPGFSRFYFGRK